MVIRDADIVDRRGGDGEILVVVGVANAAGDGQRVGEVIADLTEDSPRCVRVLQRGRRREARRSNRGDGEG